MPFSAPEAMNASTGLTDDAWTRTTSSLSPAAGSGRSSRRPGWASTEAVEGERLHDHAPPRGTVPEGNVTSLAVEGIPAGDAELVETFGRDDLYYIHERNGLGYFRSDCPLALGG